MSARHTSADLTAGMYGLGEPKPYIGKVTRGGPV